MNESDVVIRLYRDGDNWRADAYREGAPDWFLASAWLTRERAASLTRHALLNKGVTPSSIRVVEAPPAVSRSYATLSPTRG